MDVFINWSVDCSELHLIPFGITYLKYAETWKEMMTANELTLKETFFTDGPNSMNFENVACVVRIQTLNPQTKQCSEQLLKI